MKNVSETVVNADLFAGKSYRVANTGKTFGTTNRQLDAPMVTSISECVQKAMDRHEYELSHLDDSVCAFDTIHKAGCAALTIRNPKCGTRACSFFTTARDIRKSEIKARAICAAKGLMYGDRKAHRK